MNRRAAPKSSFPRPSGSTEPDGSEAFGYERGVVFPIRVRAADPSKPVTLALDANYAVCEKICLPARAAVAVETAHRGRDALGRRDRRGASDGSRRKDAAALGIELPRRRAETGGSACRAAGRRAISSSSRPRDGGSPRKRDAAEEGRDCFALSLRRRRPMRRFPARSGRRSREARARWRRG